MLLSGMPDYRGIPKFFDFPVVIFVNCPDPRRFFFQWRGGGGGGEVSQAIKFGR